MDSNNLSIESISQLMDEYNYFATDALKYRTFLGLRNYTRDTVNEGQDIYAICLEGPPGAGKSMYASIYAKLVKDIWNGQVELIEMSCDQTTGKSELVEDINITEVVKQNPDKINIPGKLTEAVIKVNQGKKVILLIDEYDKAKEETDAFLLSFLQDGKLFSPQHGDLEVKEEYKNNLQVILCKNDFREHLSGPLYRRLKIIRLDYMTPQIMHSVIMRNMVENRPDYNKVDENLINLVMIIYDNIYQNVDLFERIPACSEVMNALDEINVLSRYTNASQYIIYRTIIENLLKDIDDIEAFESLVSKNVDEKFSDLINEMKKDKKDGQDEESIVSLIGKTVCLEYSKQLESEYEIKGKELEIERDELEARKEKLKEAQTRFINAQNHINNKNKSKIQNNDNKEIVFGNYVFKKPISSSDNLSNFQDYSMYVRRGKSVFSEYQNIVCIAKGESDETCNMFILKEFIDFAREGGIVVYEDGMRFDTGSIKLFLSRSKEGEKYYYNIYADKLVLDKSVFATISDIVKLIEQIKKSSVSYSLEFLLYSEYPIDDVTETETENVYLYSLKDCTDISDLLYELSSYDTEVTNNEKNMIMQLSNKYLK